MARVHCVLETYGYKYALTICKTCCFLTATMVAQTFTRTLPIFFNRDGECLLYLLLVASC